MERKHVPNIIVFGSTGAGKSSVVNMLKGSSKASTSSAARGETFGSNCYQKTVNEIAVNVFDTAGLNEGMQGTVSPRAAIEGLFNLIGQLAEGINLLVFVMRAPRITALTQQNYRMFYEGICDKKVPIVIVVTGLEYEYDMDQWWITNEQAFKRQEMFFEGHACITATEGMEDQFRSAYEKSKEKLENLISSSLLPVPWKAQTSWLPGIAARSYNIWASVLGLKTPDLARELNAALASYGEVAGNMALANVDSDRERRGPRTIDLTPSIIILGEGTMLHLLDNYGQSDSAWKVIKGSVFRVYEIEPLMDGVGRAEGIKRILRRLTEGINLLILVVRASDTGVNSSLQNYAMLFDTLLRKGVPVVLLGTGLEAWQSPDQWWFDNKKVFDQLGIFFNGYGCTKNPGRTDENSKRKLEQLITKFYSEVPFRLPYNWGLLAVLRSYNIWNWIPGVKPQVLVPELYDALSSYGQLPAREAAMESNKIARSIWYHDREGQIGHCHR